MSITILEMEGWITVPDEPQYYQVRYEGRGGQWLECMAMLWCLTARWNGTASLSPYLPHTISLVQCFSTGLAHLPITVPNVGGDDKSSIIRTHCGSFALRPACKRRPHPRQPVASLSLSRARAGKGRHLLPPMNRTLAAVAMHAPSCLSHCQHCSPQPRHSAPRGLSPDMPGPLPPL